MEIRQVKETEVEGVLHLIDEYDPSGTLAFRRGDISYLRFYYSIWWMYCWRLY